MRNITEMLRKDSEIKWSSEAKKSFEEIKVALTKAPVLISPNFEKDFQIYSYTQLLVCSYKRMKRAMNIPLLSTAKL